MRTRIIAVLNQKGGVGKTTTCVSLGAALARRGYRVLLVDMDPQSNLTVHLGADFRQIRKSTYSLLLGEHGLGAAVVQARDPNLRYVPATLALANAEIQLASAVGRELLLREAIEAWLEDDAPGEEQPRAHFVFIDCPPSLGILTMNALCAANEVLLPIQAEFFALQGVAGILESLKAVQRLNRGLQLSMVVPCMVDKRRTLAREVMEEVDKYFGKLVTRTRIRNNVKLAEAPSHGLTIFEYDPSSNGAKDYEALAREVLGESVEGSGDVPTETQGPETEPSAGSAPEPARPDATPPDETATVAEAPAPPAEAAPEEDGSAARRTEEDAAAESVVVVEPLAEPVAEALAAPVGEPTGEPVAEPQQQEVAPAADDFVAAPLAPSPDAPPMADAAARVGSA